MYWVSPSLAVPACLIWCKWCHNGHVIGWEGQPAARNNLINLMYFFYFLEPPWSKSKRPWMSRQEQGMLAREEDITGFLPVYAHCFGTFMDSFVCLISVWEEIVTSGVWLLSLTDLHFALNLKMIIYCHSFNFWHKYSYLPVLCGASYGISACV